MTSSKRSKVWEAFHELKTSEGGRRVRCILSVDEYGPEECGHEYQLNDNSTGLMKFHIEKKHPKEFQRLFGEKIAIFSSSKSKRLKPSRKSTSFTKMVTQGQRFNGLVVIVTGSSAGIGRASILRFAKEGASVTLHGQSKEKLEDTKKALLDAGVPESRILIVAGSLENESTQDKLIEETVKRFGKLDVLINNAATPGKAGIESNSMEAFDFIMSVNVRAIYRLCQLATPYLEKTKGCIVNITSDLSERPMPQGMVYSISKASLNHLTRNFAALLASKNIRVNAVGAGLTDTDFPTRIGMPPEVWNKIRADVIQGIPLKRISQADEQAEMIVNIASPTNTYMTGTVIFNDGGIRLGSHF